MFALTFAEFGGPEVLRYRELPDPVAEGGEVLVATRAIGLNYADIYRRRGNYHLVGVPPYIAGYEGAGVVVASTDGELPVGTRVGFADVPRANATLVRVPVDKAIPLPEGVSEQHAAAILLQGLTAQMLASEVRPDDKVLILAAASGVGALLMQLAQRTAREVVGVSSKGHLAYDAEWPNDCTLVFDSVGATLSKSLASLRVGGRCVFYGMAGGDPAPVDPRLLMDRSLSLSGADLWNVLTSRQARRERARALFDAKLNVHVSRTFTLAEGADAHRFLESRQSTGKVVMLVPETARG